MSRLFSAKLIKTHWSLVPIVAITGFACGMCASYIVYMMKTKPDISFRFGDNSVIPEMKVDPDDVRKIVKINKDIKYDVEIEKLRQEISSVN